MRQGSIHSNPVLQSTKITSVGTGFYKHRNTKKDWHQTRPPDKDNSRCRNASNRQKKTIMLQSEIQDLRNGNLELPLLNKCNAGLRPIFTQNWMYLKENPGPRAFLKGKRNSKSPIPAICELTFLSHMSIATEVFSDNKIVMTFDLIAA